MLFGIRRAAADLTAGSERRQPHDRILPDVRYEPRTTTFLPHVQRQSHSAWRDRWPASRSTVSRSKTRPTRLCIFPIPPDLPHGRPMAMGEMCYLIYGRIPIGDRHPYPGCRTAAPAVLDRAGCISPISADFEAQPPPIIVSSIDRPCHFGTPCPASSIDRHMDINSFHAVSARGCKLYRVG